MATERNKTSDTAVPDTARPGRAAALATLMVVDHVKREHLSGYERWLSGIHGDLQA